LETKQSYQHKMRCTAVLLLASMACPSVAEVRLAEHTTTERNATTAELCEPSRYGVDITFPTHHWFVSTNYPELPHNVDPVHHVMHEEHADMPLQPLGDKQSWYARLLQGCRDHYGGAARMCDRSEQDRVKMSIEQPASMRVSDMNSFSNLLVDL
jgi:hypothetical protein